MAETVEYARATLGEDEWRASITPGLPEHDPIPNPYTYTDYSGSADRHRARDEDAASTS